MKRVETYLQNKFRLDTISIRPQLNKEDSAEVHIGDEFIGVLYRDDEDGDISYQFQMAILDFDLQ